jgi:hypothetical protein
MEESEDVLLLKLSAYGADESVEESKRGRAVLGGWLKNEVRQMKINVRGYHCCTL